MVMWCYIPHLDTHSHTATYYRSHIFMGKQNIDPESIDGESSYSILFEWEQRTSKSQGPADLHSCLPSLRVFGVCLTCFLNTISLSHKLSITFLLNSTLINQACTLCCGYYFYETNDSWTTFGVQVDPKPILTVC